MRCDQCEACMIQGTFCHEIGCPNIGSRFDVEQQRWIKQRKCFECGCTVDADDPCCNAEPEEELCECGREPDDCATSAGADYHADRDDYIDLDEPATYEEFCRLNGEEEEA